MPIAFRPAARLLRVDVEPPYTVDEIEQSLDGLSGMPGYRAGQDILVHLHGTQNPPAAEIRRYADVLRRYDEVLGRRIAICTDNDLAYGLSRMFAVYAASNGFEVAVFREIEAGRLWLDGEPEPVGHEPIFPPVASGGT